MPAPDYRSSRKKLISVMRETATNSREYEVAKAFLEIKGQAAMTRATWAVGFATLGLIAVTVVEIIALVASQ